MKKNILIIAGEPSGDMRAGELLKEMKPLLPDCDFWGIGGDKMAAEGAHLVEHIRNLSIIGLTEAIKKLGKIREQYRDLIQHVDKTKPSLAILIDYPGFNLKVAKYLKSKNIPVIYYVIPQVWAWGEWRIKAIKKYVNKAIVLFDFEKDLLEKNGIEAVLAGHPLMEGFPPPPSQVSKNEYILSLLPGSRKSEVEKLLPVMLDAAESIKSSLFTKPLPPGFPEDICMRSDSGKHINKEFKVNIAQSSNVRKSIYDSILSRHSSLDITMNINDTIKTLENASFAIVASGTATLEVAIMEKPMIITYQAPLLKSPIHKMFVKTPFLGLVNIIAGKEICPELLQKDATAEKIGEKALEIITSPEKIDKIKSNLKNVRKCLGEKGASLRAAKAVHHFIQENNI